MLNPNDFAVMKARNEEMMRRAEQERLAQEARENTIPAHKVVIAKVGKVLVTVGSHLEAQAGVVVNVHGDAVSPS
ncbi:MAG: hypothetical protein KJ064_10215 [Anaerolineae bacterium]|jgi:hypothetical protein|nr:MAG: hypothetical protein F9K27_11510 [Anaerolineae bacterium]MCL4877024.1 hypothetical protein [Anaerolineae bacterium]